MPNKDNIVATPNLPKKANLSVQRESIPEQAKLAPENETNSLERNSAIFQAVGIIVGVVNFIDTGKSTVTIGSQLYPLFYLTHKRKVFDALKREIERTGNNIQRLVVYPRVIHFPKKDCPHSFAFQLVGFDVGRKVEGVSKQLLEFEFKLSGLWQFIPVCRTPCISIFRNFTSERLEYIKQADLAKKVKFMKPSHLPLLWKDAPVQPFRFNPKSNVEQGRPMFVEIKAKFLPHRNAFGFIEQLAPAAESAPKFLKASKQDKVSMQQTQAKI